jgi:hypothetical protein
MSLYTTICIVPIKLNDVDILTKKKFINDNVRELFLKCLPTKYSATLLYTLFKFDDKTKYNQFITLLSTIKDLEWNFAAVITTKAEYEETIVYFMRNIYNHLQVNPFSIDNTILNLQELFKDEDFENDKKTTISFLKKFSIQFVSSKIDLSIYYLPKKVNFSSIASLPDNVINEILANLSLEDSSSLARSNRYMRELITGTITSGLLKGKLKEDILTRVFSRDNLSILKTISKFLIKSDLDPFVTKYWNAFKCWTYLCNEVKLIDKKYIYKHYPLGKALFACIVGYKYNTQTEWYKKSYQSLYHKSPSLIIQFSPNDTDIFYKLETNLKRFIKTIDLRINEFPYNYNMIDNTNTTVYCKGLPNKYYTVGLSYYDIVIKARNFYIENVQTYLSYKMLVFLFERGLSYLPNPNCSEILKLRMLGTRSKYVPYNRDDLTKLIYFFTTEDDPFLLVNIDETKTPFSISTVSDNNNIFKQITKNEFEIHKDEGLIYTIATYIDIANKEIEKQ